LTTDSSFAPLPGLTHPFLRPGTDRSAAEQRRNAVKRTTSWILVALLHVFIFLSFVISVHPFTQKGRPVVETLLLFPAPNKNDEPHPDLTPELINKAPALSSSAPIIIPKIPPPPPTPDQTRGAPTPGDILGMIGRNLACQPGSWEHLTGREQHDVCGGGPWRAYRAPNGSLVMVPPSQLPRLKQTPPPEFSINTGADRIQRDLQNGQDPSMGGCPILQNTPCVHVTPNWNKMNNN
jgi:hypothetical protein